VACYSKCNITCACENVSRSFFTAENHFLSQVTVKGFVLGTNSHHAYHVILYASLIMGDDQLMALYEDVTKSFQTACMEQELQMVQLSATRCSCITIL
jgi:hypothetical protein